MRLSSRRKSYLVMIYVLYTLLANLVPALVKAYCWQQGQEFQNHQQIAF